MVLAPPVPSQEPTGWIGLARGLDADFIIAVESVGLAAALAVLERVLPHAPAWNRYDGRFGHDVVFTLLGSGLWRQARARARADRADERP